MPANRAAAVAVPVPVAAAADSAPFPRLLRGDGVVRWAFCVRRCAADTVSPRPSPVSFADFPLVVFFYSISSPKSFVSRQGEQSNPFCLQGIGAGMAKLSLPGRAIGLAFGRCDNLPQVGSLTIVWKGCLYPAIKDKMSHVAVAVQTWPQELEEFLRQMLAQ